MILEEGIVIIHLISLFLEIAWIILYLLDKRYGNKKKNLMQFLNL